MPEAEQGYGATETAAPGDVANKDASVAECSVHLGEAQCEAEGKGEGWPGRAALSARLRAAAVAAFISAAFCGAVMTYAAGTQGPPAIRGADAAGKPLPPAVELMREVPTTLTQYVLDPYALCNDFNHTQQPVYIGLLQSGLVSATMTAFAVLPPPLGGGDPLHPGAVGFAFAGWNVFAALKLIYETLFVTDLPSGLDLSPFERYELRWWLAVQNPKFQSMVTILMHKALGIWFTILQPDGSTGEMHGWRKAATIAIFFSAGAGLAVVVLPLLVTHLLAQLVLLPVGVFTNLLNLGFYKMLLGITCATIVAAGLLVGPAAAIMFVVASLYPPEYGNRETPAAKLILNKGGAMLALLLVVFIQDFTVNSMMVYHGASGTGAAQLSAYGARQTCAWVDCAQRQAEGSSAWRKVNEWVELTPVLHGAAEIIPLDCYASDGSVTHHANMQAFLITMGVVLVITVIGMVYTLSFTPKYR
eukprot:TRINITY_DN9821_c0_g2_i1.p1 TRINITY_DN9821_c0_g2~~TRINITY_DN9821_c0_g2_i1.p1  ORF type:complete len:503 (+),score=133.19 TRINITY_DN9821_c0_g2_i1:88-1509(+)